MYFEFISESELSQKIKTKSVINYDTKKKKKIAKHCWEKDQSFNWAQNKVKDSKKSHIA